MPEHHHARGHRYDILIIGGTVVDGTGAEARRADVGVSGDCIAFLGSASSEARAAADRTIDADGLVVAPGFIDLHTHVDYTIESVPGAHACVRQGVTTAVTGNCGTSSFPAPAFGVDFAAYAARVEASEPAVNLACLVGHGSLRTAVIGADRRAATEEETRRMAELLEVAAQQGAFGLSTGLIYAPGSFADTGEVAALADVARANGLLYSTHMRNEGDGLLDALDEALDVARRTGVRLQLSHLKAMGPPNHGKVAAALARIDEARAAGLDVACDVYPYTASSTLLTSRLPDWAMDGGNVRLLQRLEDPDTRHRIAADLEAGRDWPFLPDATVLAGMPPGRYADLVGHSLRDVAARTGSSAAEAMLDVLYEHQAQVWIINHAMAEADVREVLRHPASAIGSDGWELTTDCEGSPHPRHFGTFARILETYCRNAAVLTLPEAIRKMTSLPAERLGLEDRGVLAPGRIADITVFDPEHVADTATYLAPKSYALGTKAVLVNGIPVLMEGEQTTARPGRVLRKPRP
ncbi:N-acyl-D-amino-acid deacylase family protein [Actinospica robiniae]|uniref:N-acyl-D-amino-acid deacylase family protein n=1 Tax=Actinospica robiniae TaxID=304901 RepID=UPI000419A21B|nr:D-aminoacylase [Actinospica robiniae]